MKIEVNKKLISFITLAIILLSALVYNILYINNKKNEIFEEIEFVEEEPILEEKLKTIFVDIGGEVNNPGLYELNEFSRVNDAINIAGGITDKADLTDINLAYILKDEMKIVVPKKEVKKVYTSANTISAKKVITSEISLNSSAENNSGLVNINTATKAELQTLSGIGEATAQKIIDYRLEKGKFNKIEDIKNVSGIGESKYEKIKEKIIV